jgi:hypothetical protein
MPRSKRSTVISHQAPYLALSAGGPIKPLEMELAERILIENPTCTIAIATTMARQMTVRRPELAHSLDSLKPGQLVVRFPKPTYDTDLKTRAQVEYNKRLADDPTFGQVGDVKVPVKIFLARIDWLRDGWCDDGGKMFMEMMHAEFAKLEGYYFAVHEWPDAKDEDSELAFFVGTTRSLTSEFPQYTDEMGVRKLRTAIARADNALGALDIIFQTVQPMDKYTGERDLDLDPREHYERMEALLAPCK